MKKLLVIPLALLALAAASPQDLRDEALRLDATKALLVEAANTIEGLQADKASLAGQVAALEAQLDESQATVAARDATITDLNATIDVLEARIAELEAQQPAPTCVQVTAPASIQAAVDNNPADTDFCLSGTFSVGSAVRPKSGDTFTGPATMNGAGFVGTGGTSGQQFVEITNVTITGGPGGVGIQAGWDWTITNVEVSGFGQGVRVNTRSVLRNSYLHNNSTYGLSGGPGSDILVEGNEWAFNGGTPDGGGSTGGSKIVGTDVNPGTVGLTFRNNVVHDNAGPGIWCDGNCHDVVYEGNEVYDNATIGIFHEISWNAIIRNNVVYGNGSGSNSCHYHAQIKVNNSKDIQIFGNTVSGVGGENGICLTNTNRNQTSPVPQFLQSVSVHDNDVTMDGTDESGYVGDTDYLGIVFDFNTYHAPPSGSHWARPGASASTFAAWQAFGQDPNGTAA